MEGICRGCLIKNNEPTELLQYTEKNRRLFVYSTGLQVKRNDTLPFQLCKECYVNMKLSCKFKKLCRTSDKKFKNYLTLKDAGDNVDFSTFLQNNDDTLTFRFPSMSGSSTPANQKCRDDDNESTCTSIRNFMTDILQGEEMPDTEARIIREVIEEEADVLDDSLDSHWLQDDVSIDTDFRLDFSFSPFSTPRPVNNDRYTPQKLSNQKVREQLNYYTSKNIMERHDQIEIDIKHSNMPTENDAQHNLSNNIDIEKSFIPTYDDEKNITITKIDLEPDIMSSDIEMEDSIIPIDIDMDQNFIPTQIDEEQIIPSEIDISTDNNIEHNILPTKIEVKQNNMLTDMGAGGDIAIEIGMEEIDTPQLASDNSENIKCVNEITLEKLEKGLYAASKELLSKYNIEIEQIDKTKPNFCIDTSSEKANNVKCTIDRNLENALKDEGNKEFSLDELLVSPTAFPGASTPTIKNILFGDKLDLETDNDTNEHKAGQCIENFEDVKGNIDVLDEFFGNNANDFDIEDHFNDSDQDITENGLFKVPLVPKDDDYDIIQSYCNLCKKKFKHSKSLRLHFAFKHKMNIFNPNKKASKKKSKVCHICGKLYRDGKNIKVHLERHKLEKKTYKCDICDLECVSQAKFDMHLAGHKGEFVKKNTSPKFICNICGAVSSGIANFKLHQKRHTKDYLVNCKECGKGFYRSADLTAHMTFHTGERPYKCKHCPKTFSRRDSLLRHINLHIDNKLFQCRFCNNRFTKRSVLNNHLRNSKSCSKHRDELTAEVTKDVNNSEVTVSYTVASTETINQLPFIDTERSN